MRVDIKGNNPITSDQFKEIIDELNKEYGKIGLKVKNMTCYIRFEDENGTTVEPMINGCEIKRTFTLNIKKEVSNKKDTECNIKNETNPN